MRNEERSRRRLAGPLALLLGAAALAAPTAAQAAWANSVFAGSNCRSATYSANALESAKLGEEGLAQELMCPIPRMHPTWPQLQVEIYFYDTSSGDGTNATGNASCTLETQNAQAVFGNNAYGSLTSIDPSSPLFLSTTLVPTTGESLWNSFTSSTPMWRQARLVCNGVPATAQLVTYDVWEGQ